MSAVDYCRRQLRSVECLRRAHRRKYTNVAIETANCGDCGEPPDNDRVHMLIVALDYLKTKYPLTCTRDSANMQDCARACGIKDLVVMHDDDCTKENVLAKIEEIGNRCEEDDHFVFYYAGHGENVEDTDGDEDSNSDTGGMDQAFVLVDENGEIPESAWLVDDEFSKAVTDFIPKTTKILILSDCCHSGTIADFNRDTWDGFVAASISGCADNQVSGDTGKGGYFTHALLLGIDNLTKSDDDRDGFSVAKAFNMALLANDQVFSNSQTITIQSCGKCEPGEMVWPLLPPYEYDSPLRRSRKVKRLKGSVEWRYASDDTYNPLSWSGDEYFQEAIVDLRKVQSQQPNRQICLKIPSGFYSREEFFENAALAIHRLQAASAQGIVDAFDVKNKVDIEIEQSEKADLDIVPQEVEEPACTIQ